MSSTNVTHRSVLEKLALAGGVASLGMCSATIVEGAIIASPNAPTSPPNPSGTNYLDVDGNGTNEFILHNYDDSVAILTEVNGRFVAPALQMSDGFAKLSAGFMVGPTMTGFKFFVNPQLIRVTDESQIASDASAGGWAMGNTGFFGFKFTSGANTYYGWGEIVIDPANSGNKGHGFQFTKLYYDDTGAAIKVGDTGAVIPEPSTCALALLAAGGVAAYRARRKMKAA